MASENDYEQQIDLSDSLFDLKSPADLVLEAGCQTERSAGPGDGFRSRGANRLCLLGKKQRALVRSATKEFP